jgi:diguanylate cyclase (GGDEF)-like protein/PAS domain S-box-containing protein
MAETDSRATLLVVDDEESNRDMLSRRLRRAGYQVEAAGSGQEALDRIANSPYELVLLDVMMPEMSGLDMLRLLRGSYAPNELPVIMVSALNESKKIVEALKIGANDYVTKPIDFAVTLARIESQLTRKETEAALRTSEERYALAARGSNDGIWDWDLREERVYYSPRWKQILGCGSQQLTDSPDEWLSRVHPDDRERVAAALEIYRKSAGETEIAIEHRLRHADGSYVWVLCRGVVLCDEDDEPLRMAGSLTDVTENKTFDSLTGLPNRTLFRERLAGAMERHREDPTEGYAVLFVDLDRFKVVNDSLGHLAGDQLLVTTARRLVGSVRSNNEDRQQDVVARFGGDEFAVLLEKLDDEARATEVAERVQGTIQEPVRIGDRDVFSSASIGIAIGNGEYSEPDEMLRDADTAMYRAKSLGRAQSAVFDDKMRATAMARLEVEQGLREAVAKDQFRLYYQPKIDMDSEKLLGFEALLRWHHPERGVILPGEFISVAEDTGLIVPIGLWVLREACQTMQAWHEECPSEPPLEISVNVSTKQFEQADLVDRIAEVLEETGLEPQSLQLEITETVLVQDPEAALGCLRKLKKLGVGLKIDDFGTGYSSLNYLNQFPFDSLKIDRSFVMRMPVDQRSSDVVGTILQLARKLNLEVVAEGVETAEQISKLRSLGCHCGQGFFYAQPLPVDEADQFVRGGYPCLDGDNRILSLRGQGKAKDA